MQTLTITITNDGTMSDYCLMVAALDKLASMVVFVLIKAMRPTWIGKSWSPAKALILEVDYE